MKEFFHMNKGDGELSYAQNSGVQNKAWLMNQERLERAIQGMMIWEERSIIEGQEINVLDLGCGVGAVPLGLVTFLVERMQKKWKDLKKDQVPPIKLVMYMNDLPSNDFNMLFRELLSSEVLQRRDRDGLPSCFLMSAPGSFYDRLFPHTTLHLVHSNYTLHWLSQAGIYDEEGRPLNKGNIYISETSPKEVGEAYLRQFEKDFTKFLNCRSQEVVRNGYMLLTLRGRPCSTDSFTWVPFELHCLSQAFSSLVSQGIIEEETLDNFNFPCYISSTDQLESIVKKEGSFEVEDSKTMIFDVAPEIVDKWAKAQFITKFIRAFSESLVSNYFGEDILSPLYDKLLCLLFQFLDHGHPTHHAVTILLRKI